MMLAYRNWLKDQAVSSITQPLSSRVDSNDENYLADQGYKKLGWRHFRRRVQFALSRQQKHLENCIQPTWKRGLWIYKGVPQIGDALMDLAPRSLLRQQGFRIDLYTDSHLAVLFNGDPWFERVYDNPRMIESQDYDFVIVQSHKGRSLRHKSRLLPSLPWLSMHGFYTGPEFHRGKFATRRVMDFLEYEATTLEFSQHQQQKLRPLAPRPKEFRTFAKIAFALGGVDALRTYQNWRVLTRELLQSNVKMEITLLGSSNAVQAAEVFMSEFAGTVNVMNKVNKTSLTECRELIHQQDLLIATDGGLMHLGTTTQAKLISVFHAGVSPHWRLSGAHLAGAIQSNSNAVSTTPTSAIVQAVIHALDGESRSSG
jgi:hypothetical protein